MRNWLNIIFFFTSLWVCGQDFQTDLTSSNFEDATASPFPNFKSEKAESFEKAASKYGITQKTFTNINEVENGYFVINGVYKKSRNLKSEVKKLTKKGFNAGYFQNPDNELYYTYLNRYGHWSTAFEAYESNFNGRYEQDVWVLKIVNNTRINDVVPLEDVTYDMLQEVQQTSSDIEPKSNLIKKADSYFNKMWYAEAAGLYELALENDGQTHYSFDVLQKAGDAHYFNTDMEKAYKWYHILFENYEDQMSLDNIFKYAHSLKGTGNYNRSKRLMKLYNRKLRGEDNISKRYERNEVVLDGLMRMKDMFAVENLKINTEYSDFSPMFYNDEELVFASAKDSSIYNTRRYKWNNQPYLDIYVAKVNEESQEVKNAIKFSKKINTKYHEASVTFSPDNKTMYFTRNNYGKKLKRDTNGINNLKIYRSTKIDDEWVEAEELPFNSDDYSTGHPALSKDGKQLYFVSDMPGSIGETDIFVVDVLEGGSFSTPKNLGPEINTEQKEMFPYINDKKLYFSSNGHIGLGGLDVFEVTLDDEKVFKEVKNVGKPVNSKKDDFSFIINEETQRGYFASNRAGGKGDDDIYAFKKLQAEEIQTNKNAIAGIVTDLVTGAFMPNALISLLDENNIKLKEMEADENGRFVFEDLEGATRYILKTTNNQYYEDNKVTATKNNEVINLEISLKKLNGMVVVENGIRKLKTEMIYFDFDKSHIRTDASFELDKLVTLMKESPTMVIKIESHTDSRGNAVYNKYLSDNRAKSTRDYIIAQGIDPKRIESAIGYGEEKLLNRCDGSIRCTEEQHYLNRRSEFIIVSM